jgi:phosphoglucosamine mutase
MKLFSTSGIRRKVSNLPPSFAVNVGLAISKALCKNKGKVLLGRDARLSGPMLENAISAGLIAGGCHVERKGIVPTPAIAYHTHKTDACVGVMLTASHNPPEYNGIKVFDKTSMGLSPEDEQKIEQAMASKELPAVSWEKFGKEDTIFECSLYEEMLANAGAKINPELFENVIVDPGGGASCEMVMKNYSELGLNIVSINSTFDPFFSNRPSEPNEKNLLELIAFTKKQVEKNKGKTIGLAYDGDGDRCVAIDEKGRFIPLDMLIALYAKFVVEQNGGKGLIITHVDASMLIDKLVTEAGGEVKRTKVGDVAIGNMVANEQAIFGGEPCGAWIHPEYHLCPDGPLTGLKILEWASQEGPISEIIDTIQDFPVNRTKVPCDNQLKQQVLAKLDKQVSAEDSYTDLLKIDGLRINYEDDSWVLIRPSGTEPYFRVTSQAMTKEESIQRMQHYEAVVKKVIKKLKQ